MDKKWKIGDVVRLKSGGVAMVVAGYKLTTPYDSESYIAEDETDVKVSWQLNGKASYSVYHEDMLEED